MQRNDSSEWTWTANLAVGGSVTCDAWATHSDGRVRKASVWKGSTGVGTCQLRSNQRLDPGTVAAQVRRGDTWSRRVSRSRPVRRLLMRRDDALGKKHGMPIGMRGGNERNRRRAVGGAKKFLFGRRHARHEIDSGPHARFERAHLARTIGQAGRLRPGHLFRVAFDLVVVNGKIAVEDGKLTSARGGKALRKTSGSP